LFLHLQFFETVTDAEKGLKIILERLKEVIITGTSARTYIHIKLHALLELKKEPTRLLFLETWRKPTPSAHI